MDMDSLLMRLRSGEAEQWTAALRDVVDNDDRGSIPVLLQVLSETKTDALRNRAALALSDLGAEECVAVIFDLVSRPETENSRGTLLYALERFDCHAYLGELVGMVISGSFEVSRQALLLIQNIKGCVPKEQREEALSRLHDTLANIQDRYSLVEGAIYCVEGAISSGTTVVPPKVAG
jgi:HEAT repeat protein